MIVAVDALYFLLRVVMTLIIFGVAAGLFAVPAVCGAVRALSVGDNRWERPSSSGGCSRSDGCSGWCTSSVQAAGSAGRRPHRTPTLDERHVTVARARILTAPPAVAATECGMPLGRWRRRRQGSAEGTDVVHRADRPVVVSALPLSAAAREHLADRLGDVEVRDVRDVVLAAELVLTPSCSPQAIAALKEAHPTARLVVVELEDADWDIHLSGPVKRVLAAGADAYLAAGSIEDLCDQLRGNEERPSSEAEQRPALGQRSVDDLILASAAEMMRRRAESAGGARQEPES